jgi:hypothetical protein
LQNIARRPIRAFETRVVCTSGRMMLLVFCRCVGSAWRKA